jgi:hypothetical protein
MKKYNKFRKLPVVKKKICNAEPRHLKLPENFSNYVQNMSHLCRIVFIFIISVNGILAFTLFRISIDNYLHVIILFFLAGVICPVMLIYRAYYKYLRYIDLVIHSFNSRTYYNFDYEYLIKVKNFFELHAISIAISLIALLIFILYFLQFFQIVYDFLFNTFSNVSDWICTWP